MNKEKFVKGTLATVLAIGALAASGCSHSRSEKPNPIEPIHHTDEASFKFFVTNVGQKILKLRTNSSIEQFRAQDPRDIVLTALTPEGDTYLLTAKLKAGRDRGDSSLSGDDVAGVGLSVVPHKSAVSQHTFGLMAFPSSAENNWLPNACNLMVKLDEKIIESADISVDNADCDGLFDDKFSQASQFANYLIAAAENHVSSQYVSNELDHIFGPKPIS